MRRRLDAVSIAHSEAQEGRVEDSWLAFSEEREAIIDYER